MSTARAIRHVRHGSLPLPSRRRLGVRRLTPTVSCRVLLLQPPLLPTLMPSIDSFPPMLPLLLTMLQLLNLAPLSLVGSGTALLNAHAGGE